MTIICNIKDGTCSTEEQRSRVEERNGLDPAINNSSQDKENGSSHKGSEEKDEELKSLI